MDYQFKDPLPLAPIVRFVLLAWLLLSFCYGVIAACNILMGMAFQSGSITFDDLGTVDTITQAVAIPMVAVNLLTVVLVARWIYRLNKNAHALSDAMVMSPGGMSASSSSPSRICGSRSRASAKRGGRARSRGIRTMPRYLAG